jgi:hypothetical protein
MHWNFLYPEEKSGGSRCCRSQPRKITFSEEEIKRIVRN